MRVSNANGPLRVRAVAGTKVVLIAWDLNEASRNGLRGFAIQRSIAGSDAPAQWLKGLKYFAGTVQNPVAGAEYSTREQPLQAFLWSDWEASPQTKYRFRLVALYGPVNALSEGASVEFEITTEADNDRGHGVWFNRGAVASHAMATQWKNRQITPAMFNNVSVDGKLLDDEVAWLSRGLAEACLSVINGAKRGEGLRVCAYEFTYQPVLLALKRAIERGVDVQIVYHYTKKDSDENLKAINAARLPETALVNGVQQQVLFQRTRTSIPHNKFIVHINNGDPVAVWTGSTNFTDSGFLGQTNVGHLVTDTPTAQTYLKYWSLVKEDETHLHMVQDTADITGNPANVIEARSIVPFYSPRSTDAMLSWYADRIKDAQSLAVITIPFNVAPAILDGLGQQSSSLRLVVLENPPTADVEAAEKANHGQLVFSNGAIMGQDFVRNPRGGAKVVPIAQSKVDQWFIDEELVRPTNVGHVFFLHSKFLLIDPLSDDPLVCSGSANFSTNSLTGNDENMLLIRGSTRIADIYLTEFDRIFRHFYARDWINRSAKAGDTDNPLILDQGSDWVARNFNPDSYKNARRLMFFPVKEPQRTWVEAAAADPDRFANG